MTTTSGQRSPPVSPQRPASPPDAGERGTEQGRRAFFWRLETLIALVGVGALVMPAGSELLVTRLLGLLLMLAGFVALLVAPAHARRRGPIIAGAAVAFATGALVQWVPASGLPSLGALIGLLLLGHGLMASSVALRWDPGRRGLVRFALGLGAILLLLAGVALLAGWRFDEAIDRMIVGVDIVLFGGFVAASRMLVDLDPARKP